MAENKEGKWVTTEQGNKLLIKDGEVVAPKAAADNIKKKKKTYNIRYKTPQGTQSEDLVDADSIEEARDIFNKDPKHTGDKIYASHETADSWNDQTEADTDEMFLDSPEVRAGHLLDDPDEYISKENAAKIDYLMNESDYKTGMFEDAIANNLKKGMSNEDALIQSIQDVQDKIFDAPEDNREAVDSDFAQKDKSLKLSGNMREIVEPNKLADNMKAFDSDFEVDEPKQNNKYRINSKEEIELDENGRLHNDDYNKLNMTQRQLIKEGRQKGQSDAQTLSMLDKDRFSMLGDEQSINDAKTLNLEKYGFVRAQEEDFSDDGNRFTGYYYDPNKTGDKRIRLSKHVSNGDAYLSARYYNPNNRKYKALDSLNGVSYQNAIKGLPQLQKDVDAFLENEIGDYEKVTDISEQDINDISIEASNLMREKGMNEGEAIRTAIKNRNLDYDSIRYDSTRALDNALKQVKPYDKQKLKEHAAEWLKAVQKEMTSYNNSYGRNYSWHNAKTLEDAINYLGNSYPINQYPDSVRKKIIQWGKERLEKLYDFDLED